MSIKTAPPICIQIPLCKCSQYIYENEKMKAASVSNAFSNSKPLKMVRGRYCVEKVA